MSNTCLLGVRPKPNCIESLNGYLLRLADLNGLESIYILNKKIGMYKPKVTRFGIWSAQELDRLSTALYKSLGRDTNFKSFCSLRYFSYGMRTNRMFDNLVLDNPRICPICVKETRLFDWRWESGSVLRCEKHRIQLLDSCPKCGKRFTWSVALLEGCSHCAFKWKNWTAPLIEPPSDIELRCYPSVDGHTEAKDEDMIAFCGALMLMARPLDLTHDRMMRLPGIKGLSNLTLQAYEFLQSQQFRNEWKQAAKATHGDWHYLSNDLGISNKVTNDSLPYTPNYISLESQAFLLPARLQKLWGEDVNAVRHQVNHSMLAGLLGIDRKTMFYITQSDGFPMANRSKIIRSKLFFTHRVFEYLDAFVSKVPKGYVRITEKNKRLKPHLTNYGLLVRQILEGKVQAKLKQRRTLSEVYMCANDFENWLTSQLSEALKAPVGLSKTACVLRTTNPEVKTLLESGRLRIAKWQRGHTLIDGPSLANYLKELSYGKSKV